MSNYAQKYSQKQQIHSSKPEDAKSVMSYQSRTTNKSSNSNAQSKKSEVPTKQELVENMKQNDDKHKQMMHENLRRRKQKEKELKLIEDRRKEEEIKMLEQRKKTKEEAYVKYLRVNSKNVLQQLKGGTPSNHNFQIQKQPIDRVEKQSNNFAALDVEMVDGKKQIIAQGGYHRQKGTNNNCKVREDFEEKWEQQVQEYKVLRKSELLDSLDLEVSTKPKSRKVNNEVGLIVVYNQKQIEELIGYENAESEDEDEFWNQTMKNGKLQQLKHKNEKEQQQCNVKEKKDNEQQQQQAKPLTRENLNEQNNLIRKEEQMLKENAGIKYYLITNFTRNSQNKTQTALNLPPRVDQKVGQNLPSAPIRNQSPKEQKIITNIQPGQNRNASVGRQPSKPQPQPTLKKMNPPIEQPQKQQIRRKSPNTIATRDEDIDVQEFLKDDLKNLNQQEQELQKQLQQINQGNQQKISEINAKYNIRANLVSSQQVRNGDKSLQQVPVKKEQTEEERIEASLMRLDYLLIKKPDQQQQQSETFYPPFPQMLQQNTQYLSKIQNDDQKQQDQWVNQVQPPPNTQYQQPNFNFNYQQPTFQPPFSQQNTYQQQSYQQNTFQQPSFQPNVFQVPQPPPFQEQNFLAYPQQFQQQTEQKNTMQDSLDFDNLIQNKKEQFIYHRIENPTVPSQNANKYNYEIPGSNNNKDDYLKTLLQERPDIIERLGYVKADQKEDISRSEQYQESQVSEVSRDFKISRKKVHRKDSKKLGDNDAKGYAQTAAMKKQPRGNSASRQQQQPDDIPLDEVQEGKIKLEGDLRHLLVDDSQ